MRFLLLSLLFTLSSVTKAATEVYFSPGGRCESRLVKMIDGSKKTLDIIVYAINNPRIVDALIRAHKRKVKIQILTDRLQAFNNSSRALDLYLEDLDIKIHSKYKIEHNKFGIADNKWLEMGSFNWTAPAQEKNSENCIFTTVKSTIAPFKKRFNELWSLNSYQASDAYFQRLIDRRSILPKIQ